MPNPKPRTARFGRPDLDVIEPTRPGTGFRFGRRIGLRIGRFVLVATAAMAILSPASMTYGQAENPSGATKIDVRSLGLELRPLVAEALGLRMNPPLGATVQVQRVEERVTVSLVDGSEIPGWSMRIHTLTSSLADPTPDHQIDQLVESWRRDGRDFQVLASEPITCDGRAGRLCYLRLENTNGDSIVSGWLILPFVGQELLVFSIQMMTEEFSRLRGLLDSSFSTIRVESPQLIVDKRKNRLDAGAAFLAAVTPEHLKSLVGRTTWFRYYIPAGAASAKTDTELGYYAVTFGESPVGAIDPNRAPSRYDDSEQTLGLLVHVAAHYIDPGSDLVYDSDAYYWMAWDRSEEAWSIRGTSREGSREESEALTGIRTPVSTGDPLGTITVINSARNGAKRDEKSWRVPDVYLSQAPRWAMGRLLVLTRAAPQSMSAYCFDTTSPTPGISMRVDKWGPVTDGLARWRLISQARSDMPQVVSYYDDEGWLLRRSWTGGQVSEPIELEELHRLWRSKGLATGRMKR